MSSAIEVEVAEGLVRGWTGARGTGLPPKGIVLAHGAGSNANAPLLRRAAEAFLARGWTTLRLDLPFRQQRPKGPPWPASAGQDREGLRQAVAWMRRQGAAQVVLAGHSYGGRQASILAAEEPTIADLLLIFAYPLHPPGKPQAVRTAHFPQLRIPSVFVHGSQDPFGSLEDLERSLQKLPVPARLLQAPGSGHQLLRLAWSEVIDQVEGALDGTKYCIEHSDPHNL